MFCNNIIILLLLVRGVEPQRIFGEVKNRAEYEHPKSAAYAARPLAA